MNKTFGKPGKNSPFKGSFGSSKGKTSVFKSGGKSGKGGGGKKK